MKRKSPLQNKKQGKMLGMVAQAIKKKTPKGKKSLVGPTPWDGAGISPIENLQYKK